MDGEVNLPGQERLVELAGEHVAPVYDGERDVRVVLAGGLDDPDLDFEARRPQHPGAAVGLPEGEPGAPRPQDDESAGVQGDWWRLGRLSSAPSPSRASSRRRTSTSSTGEPASARA